MHTFLNSRKVAEKIGDEGRFQESIDNIWTFRHETQPLQIVSRCDRSHSPHQRVVGTFWSELVTSKQSFWVSLSLAPRVRSLITKTKLFQGDTWITPRSLVHLTSALVRSCLIHGREAFITTADSLWLDLERVELAAVKVTLGLPKIMTFINDLVYQEVG